MIDKNQSLETSRLISGGGFADPNQEQHHLPTAVDYHWNAYLASGEVEYLAKIIEYIHLIVSDAIMERLGKLWNAYLSTDIECLARAIEITEIYGNKEITAEIAKILRDKPPTNKFRKAIKRRELEVLHKHLSKNGMKKDAIYRPFANF